MIKYILLAVVAWALPGAVAYAGDTAPVQTQIQTTPIATWDDIVKESIDASHAVDMQRALAASPVPSDLTLDTGFFLTGMSVFWPPDHAGASRIEHALRVQPIYSRGSLTGFWVVGRRKHAGEDRWTGIVARLKMNGTLAPFGDSDTPGFRTFFGGWDINDAVIVDDRIYFVGSSVSGLTTRKVFSYDCSILSSGEPCPGFGPPLDLGYKLVLELDSHGATGNSYAQRIVYDPTYGLLIGGKVRTSRGDEIVIVRADPITGALITQFRGDGINVGLPSWAAQSGANIDVRDMLLTSSNTPGGSRLYVAGSVRHELGDYAGYTLTINPATSYSIPGVTAWHKYEYEADNGGSGWKADGVSALGVQRDGKLLIAGWSETAVPGDRRLFLARAETTGALDTRFCEGLGLCLRYWTHAGVTDDDYPSMIAQRAGTHDIVVALKHRNPAPGDPHLRQEVWQYSASGNTVHARQVMDFAAAAGTSPSSVPMSGWIGNTKLFAKHDAIAVAGFRTYKADDMDMTVSYLLANDSIFADRFGGSLGD